LKNIKTLVVTLSLLTLSIIPAKALNIIFSYNTTTSTTSNNGMDLFALENGQLITNTMSPSVFFSLGYVDPNFNFSTATKTSLQSSISYIGSSAINWFNTGTSGTASGGKPTVSFDNGGNGFNTSGLGWAGKQLVAVVSLGVNPTLSAFSESTQVAIVRSSSWAPILATDASPSPTTMSLNTLNFDQIFLGKYTANAGNVNASGTLIYDTISIPEPSSASLLALGVAGLVALRIRRKS
jgi:hypothetical protein